MSERIAIVASRSGLHARPAAIFTEAVQDTGVQVTVARTGDPREDAMDAASILSLMALGAAQGEELVLRAEGAGAGQALDALVQVLETDHDAA